MALLLLRACRSPDARAGVRQIGAIANFLALRREEFIMERSGTIISANRKVIEKLLEKRTWVKLLSG